MKLDTFYSGADLYRKEKIVYAHFLKPHRILSTCRSNGGVREDLDYLINHQACEPSQHTGTDLCEVAMLEPLRYLKRITSKAGIESERVAILHTAANMNNTAIEHDDFDELEVIAVCTAGVSNAGRAGDPASYHQGPDGIKKLAFSPPPAGTINTIVFINEELTAGTLLVAATVATEAKTSILQELRIPSHYSDGLATGTGTDQIAIAAQLGTAVVHTDANKHSKLGELIGQTVRGALKQALNLQCGITADSRRSSILQLERFGETRERFTQAVSNALPPEMSALLANNFLSVNHDPIIVAAVQACIHIKDQLTWGILPPSCAKDSLFYQAALIVHSVSGKSLTPETFLNDWSAINPTVSNETFLELIHQAFACGFALKWQGRFED